MAEHNTAGTVKEFVVGATGGITQVMIGQPFDIVKVRMQVQGNKSAIQVARDIWTHEGLLAFYKGTLPPLLGVGACISIVYSTFHTISLSLQSTNNSSSPNPPTPIQTYLAGGLAGLANSIISGPTEHIRIRLQTQSLSLSSSLPQSHKPNAGGGIYACIRQIHSQAGIRGLYRGQTPTMLREFGSYGVWFSVYEYLISHIAISPPHHHDLPTDSNELEARETERKGREPGREDLPTWKIASCGVVTGLILWTVNYPFDVVKSKMQADGFGSEQQYRSLRDVVRQTYGAVGWRGFWRGLGPTLLRAGPVSGGTFVVVEMVRRAI